VTGSEVGAEKKKSKNRNVEIRKESRAENGEERNEEKYPRSKTSDAFDNADVTPAHNIANGLNKVE